MAVEIHRLHQGVSANTLAALLLDFLGIKICLFASTDCKVLRTDSYHTWVDQTGQVALDLRAD